jgi:hypothetical protein
MVLHFYRSHRTTNDDTDAGQQSLAYRQQDPWLVQLRLVLPCMSELPPGTKPARLEVGVSPRLPRACKPATELGAAPAFAVPNPDSRLGLSPHSQGRVMDETSAVFVGIDVSRDRLDVHLRPTHTLCRTCETTGTTSSGAREKPPGCTREQAAPGHPDDRYGRKPSPSGCRPAPR